MPDSIIKADNISSLSGGGIGFPDGSVSNPSLKFTNDGDTGLYRIGNNTIGIASNGSRVGEIGNGYGGFTGNVIQVQSTAKTDNFSNGGTTFVDITGLSVSITPKYNSSKILILFDISVGSTTNHYIMFQLVRDSTPIYIGTDSKTYIATKIHYMASSSFMDGISGNFLDSPNSSSTIVYKIQGKSSGATTWTVNRRVVSDDTSVVSSITAMEIQQ